jgi:hypothetical protein
MKNKNLLPLNWWKNVALILGILFAMFGFYVDHSNQNNWVVVLFARDYVQALAAYDKMLNSGSAIDQTDLGFDEIASIFSGELSGPGDLTVASIKITRNDSLDFKGNPIAQDFVLGIVLQDGRTLTGIIGDLRPKIQERFMENSLFHWSQLFFWFGVGLILFEHFVLDRFFSRDS